MKNIERRRKIRRLVPFLLVAGALALAAGILALVLLIPRCSGKTEPSAATTPAPTALPTETAEPSDIPEPTDTPAPEGTPELTVSPAPTEEPTAAPTAAPASSGPIRISDETSSAVVTVKAVTRYSSDGTAHIVFRGRMAIGYLNNTDRILYSAGFVTDAIEISSVTLDGASARFERTENGFTVPFLNELPMGASFEIFVEFTADAALSDTVTLLSMDYDTAFRLTAFIESDIPLDFVGCRSRRSQSGKTYSQSAENVSVHSFKMKVG